MAVPGRLRARRAQRRRRWADLVQRDAPLLWWRLGELVGTTAVDRSGVGNDGTYSGSYTLGQAGLLVPDPDRSSLFAGGKVASSYSPFTANSQRTFEGWAYRNTSTTTDVLFGGSLSTSPILWLVSGGNNVAFYPQSSSLGTWTGAWPGNGVSVHWVLLYDDASPTTTTLYINGVSKGSVNWGAQKYHATLAGNFQVGCREASNDPFDGRIDEIVIYSGLLSPAKILEHYLAGIG